MRNIHYITLLTTFLFSSVTLADDSKFIFEPLYGVETAFVRYPEPGKYVTRATYGARAVYGTTFLSGEAEYTQAKSRQDYPSQNMKVEDSADRLAVGLRTTLPFSQYIGFFIRAGGRASQGKSKVTTNSVEETKDNPLRIDPYAGAGFQLAFGSNLAFNAGATMIRNAENKYDAQYTLGLSARFGNR